MPSVEFCIAAVWNVSLATYYNVILCFVIHPLATWTYKVHEQCHCSCSRTSTHSCPLKTMNSIKTLYKILCKIVAWPWQNSMATTHCHAVLSDSCNYYLQDGCQGNRQNVKCVVYTATSFYSTVVVINSRHMRQRGNYGTWFVYVCVCRLWVYTLLKAFVQLDGYIDWLYAIIRRFLKYRFH